jgi:hypothetical protein
MKLLQVLQSGITVGEVAGIISGAASIGETRLEPYGTIDVH